LRKKLWLWSSREHAAWAVLWFQMWCPAFADIFRNNCLNVGVLPVQVSAAFADHSKLSKQILTELEVNLPEQIITLKATGEKESFDLRLQKII
jgi:3-isopropylmalate/(R)-2-methylmalate dehydratase small subunit